MSAAEKPHFRVIANRPVQVNRRESPLESARRRYGRPFAHEAGAEAAPITMHSITYWTVDRVKALKEDNERRRKERK